MLSNEQFDKALEERLAGRLMDVLIRAGLILAMVFLCYKVFSPFLTLMVWALILAVTLYPAHQLLAGKLSGDMKAKLEAATERVKAALKGESVSEMKSATEALNQLWQQASTELYRQTTSQQASTGGASSSPGDNGHSGASSTDKVVDAEFEEVK